MDYTSIKVGQLPTDAIANTNLIPHEVGGLLKKATIADLAAFIGSSSAVGFRAVSVPNGGTLPTTTQQEFILVGPGTYNNVGGGSPITVTEELNALVSNGTFWFIGVQIPIDPAVGGTAIWGGIGGNLPDQPDLQTALNAKEPSILSGTTAQYWRGDKSWQTLNKAAVGLANVDNTSDANKPVSTATQTALDLKANDDSVVKLTGNQNITGRKEFNNSNAISGTSSIYVNNDNTSGTGIVVQNNSTGGGFALLNSSTGLGMNLQSYSTGKMIRHQNPSGIENFSLNADGELVAQKFIKENGTAAQILAANGSVITAGTNITISGGVISASGVLSGSGTIGRIPLFTSSSALGNSSLQEQTNEIQSSKSIFIINSKTSDVGLFVANSSTSNTSSTIQVSTASSSGTLINGIGSTGSSNFFVRGNGSGYFAGNVGIGTASPSGGIGTTSAGTLLDIYDGTTIGNNGGALVLSALGNSSRKLNLGQIRTILTDGTVGAEKGDMAFSTMTGSTLSERMRISSSGDVGIGTSTPIGGVNQRVLQVDAAQFSRILSTSQSVTVVTTANSVSNLGAVGTSSNHPFLFVTNDTERMRITSAGNVVIGNLGTGTVYSNAGTLTNTNPSDERLKENITDLGYGLNEILQLRPVSYNWINDTANQGTQFGFIAQEVQEIMPELINEFTITEDDEEVVRLGLDKEAIFVTLVNAIKELKAEINVLKN